jgi:hypothetical protein
VSGRWRHAAAAGLSLLVPLTLAPPATDELSGPVVLLDRTGGEPGDKAVVSIQNFESAWVTVVVCGNEARRGAGDCAMPAGRGIETRLGEPSMLELTVAAPPVPCPCVVRAVGRDTTELAVAPFEVVGHPVADVVEGQSLEGLVDTDLQVVASPDSFLGAARSSLGGATRYLVTVAVRNRSSQPLTAVRVAGDARRGGEVVARLELGTPSAIPPGQTWRTTIAVEIGAVSIGEVQWQVVTSGAGPSTTTVVATNHQPLLLLAAAVLVVVCFALLGFRFLSRRHAEADEAAGRGADAPSVDVASLDAAGSTVGADGVAAGAFDLVSSATERP